MRDIEATLGANATKLYGMGLRQAVRRSTLADANERRDWRIWCALATVLIRRARKLYAQEDSGVDVNIAGNVYALDSSTIDLCLSLFDWAPFRSTKAAIKLHTLLDLRGAIPSFIHISDGKLHDVNVLDILPIEAGAFYVMDRGYVDFARLYAMHQSGAFFVTPAKSNIKARRVYSAAVDKTTGLICDQRIKLCGTKSLRLYPEYLRRVSDTAACARSWEQTSQENKVYPSYDDEDCYVITGTNGSLSVPTMRLKTYPRPEDRSWWKEFEVGVVDDPIQHQMVHFGAVVRGEVQPLVSAQDGLANLRITEAISQAAKSGKIVQTGAN